MADPLEHRSVPVEWNILPPETIPVQRRMAHIRQCSDFAAGLLDRFPAWAATLQDGAADNARAPDADRLGAEVNQHGLETGLRRFRNREMLRIVWRDLCGLATLGETFANLTALAEVCLQLAQDEHRHRLEEKHGVPRGPDDSPQQLFVIGLGKLGGAELNVSSDIDVLFCYPHGGVCDGRRQIANELFFTRQVRAVIASLSDVTEDGFCFRVDTRLRPFGDSGPLTSSLAALEQYYQREGRDWERYALIKARPVAGDLQTGAQLVENLRPFVYRRYIDYGSVEALQEMHANVLQDARRRARLDDIKRGPGGIREIEFLAQCFQLLRGGREPGLQTPSLAEALNEIGRLELLDRQTVDETRHDYAFLRLLENRIQALRDQQTHRLPEGDDRERIARTMSEANGEALVEALARTRDRVSTRFHDIFPARAEPGAGGAAAERWRSLSVPGQEPEPRTAETEGPTGGDPLDHFVRRLGRTALSQRARQRLDHFMPGLLERLEGRDLPDEVLHRVFDLVLSICRRSAYLVLLVQRPEALDRMLELFERSAWVAGRVIRFPALLDELIDPALGRHLPGLAELEASVRRILDTATGTEAVLDSLNYLKLASELRIAVGQLQGDLEGEQARTALSDLAAAVLAGILELAGREITARHGQLSRSQGGSRDSGLAIIGYGSLGAAELGYASDLDLVFLFQASEGSSDGPRPLPAERYHARLAQRVLSLLTVRTPSGRLYEVDTRLRPNGRAGSLVSTIEAFRNYQEKEAWTWELQALTRARFIAGNRAVAAQFSRIRQSVLCRPRDAQQLAAELLEMRRRMSREHSETARDSAKHRPGGLVDIEFIAQLGVLSTAAQYPRVLRATGTLPQLQELAAIRWLSDDEYETLAETMRRLRCDRMLAVLLPGREAGAPDTTAAAQIFEARLGGPGTDEE